MEKHRLLSRIKEADDAYYNQDNPIMSDSEYDLLRNDYIERYGRNELDYVPGDSTVGFRHYKHPCPVASLGKIKESEPDKVREAIDKLWPCVIEPKLDGLTVVAYPNDDGTASFVTRGSGFEGDILPNFISDYEGICYNTDNRHPIRGEVFLHQEVFDLINKERKEAGEPLFANPRNAAAGILRNKTRSKYIDKLDFSCYDVLGVDWGETKKNCYIEDETIFAGTDIVAFPKKDMVFDAIKEYYDWFKDLYPIDGIVIKHDEDGGLAKFGSTGHHPNNAIAWKAEQAGKTTELIDVEWQVGKKYITPVAVFNPIEIDGTIVSKASVHNISIIKSLNLHKKDIVKVIKANEIIPQIIEVAKSQNGDKIEVPSKCPCCGAAVQYEKDRIFCPNDNCDEKVANKITYIASKKLLNIETLSIEKARKLVQYFKSESIPVSELSIFGLTYEEIAEIPGIKNKDLDGKNLTAKNLYNGIFNAGTRGIDISVAVAICCIPDVGLTVGNILQKRYGTIENLLSALSSTKNSKHIVEELMTNKGIGKTLAETMVNSGLLSKLTMVSNLIKINKEENREVSSALRFVLTGKMEKPRSEYERLIKNAGHQVMSAVSKSTDFLVVADISGKNSTKSKKAKELGIPVITCNDLENMLIEET